MFPLPTFQEHPAEGFSLLGIKTETSNKYYLLEYIRGIRNTSVLKQNLISLTC